MAFAKFNPCQPCCTTTIVVDSCNNCLPDNFCVSIKYNNTKIVVIKVSKIDNLTWRSNDFLFPANYNLDCFLTVNKSQTAIPGGGVKCSYNLSIYSRFNSNVAFSANNLNIISCQPNFVMQNNTGTIADPNSIVFAMNLDVNDCILPDYLLCTRQNNCSELPIIPTAYVLIPSANQYNNGSFYQDFYIADTTEPQASSYNPGYPFYASTYLRYYLTYNRFLGPSNILLNEKNSCSWTSYRNASTLETAIIGFTPPPSGSSSIFYSPINKIFYDKDINYGHTSKIYIENGYIWYYEQYVDYYLSGTLLPYTSTSYYSGENYPFFNDSNYTKKTYWIKFKAPLVNYSPYKCITMYYDSCSDLAFNLTYNGNTVTYTTVPMDSSKSLTFCPSCIDLNGFAVNRNYTYQFYIDNISINCAPANVCATAFPNTFDLTIESDYDKLDGIQMEIKHYMYYYVASNTIAHTEAWSGSVDLGDNKMLSINMRPGGVDSSNSTVINYTIDGFILDRTTNLFAQNLNGIYSNTINCNPIVIGFNSFTFNSQAYGTNITITLTATE